MTQKFDMTIGGQTVTADSYTDICNPANTEEVVGQAPVASSEHLEQAIAAARKAFETWRFSSDEQRVEACQAIAKVCSDNAEELAVLLTKEQGKPMGGIGSNFELGGCAAWAGHTASLSLPDKVLEDSDEKKVIMKREPLGVVGSITPWNFPLIIAIWHIVPGIRTGNTVVIKPSPFTPLSTLRLVQLMNEVLPPGLVNIISGGDELGAELTNHSGIDKIVFTGSVATGKKVMSVAAKGVLPVTLELGGNDPGIVLPGTDPAPFVEGLFFGSMINSGQTCGALKRLYVHEDDLEAVSGALVEFSKHIPMGDGMDESTLLGPIQNKRSTAPKCLPAVSRWAARTISTRSPSLPAYRTACGWLTKSSSDRYCRLSRIRTSTMRSAARTIRTSDWMHLSGARTAKKPRALRRSWKRAPCMKTSTPTLHRTSRSAASNARDSVWSLVRRGSLPILRSKSSMQRHKK
jgi:acyl-CoA reductase-like NAD-dependent aldehyde dehydrogenase